MFRWLRKVVERIIPARRRKRKRARRPAAPREPRRRAPRTYPEPEFLPPLEPRAPHPVEPGDDWIDADPEWGEIHPDLIGEVIEDMILEFEAKDYL